MLLAGWEVRRVKTFDRGLENAARGRRPWAAFSSPRSQFSTIRTDPKPVNNLFTFSKLSNERKTHEKTGAIHSTKISESKFENFLGANGSRRVRKVSSVSRSIPLSKRVSRSFKRTMLDSCCSC